jgi:FkbM family methyltransferase
MALKKKIFYFIIKINRYILKRKFIPILAGSLKGYLWSTGYNHDYLAGDYEDETTLREFCSWLKPGTILYDLGANVGYFAILANKYISTGIIYSFEPIPYNTIIFKKHLELNKKKIRYNNIQLLEFAISDKEGEVSISHDRFAIEGNTYIKRSLTYINSTNTLQVKCYSIDGLLEKGYKRPDVIKIDVEGAEYDVLRGAEKTLTTYRPNILLATHDCHLPGVQKLCVDFLKGLGYELKLLGSYNKSITGLEDYIAIHKENCR